MESKVFILNEEDYSVFESLYGYKIKPDVFAFGMVTDGKPSALALVRPDEKKPVWWLEWLYVEPSLRRNKIGTSLIYRVVELLDECGFSDTIVTVCANEDVKAFLETMGFYISASTGYRQFTTTLGRIQSGKAINGSALDIRRINDLSEGDKKKLEKDLADDESTGFWPICGEDYLNQSVCAYDGDELKALLLLAKEDDAIVISFVCIKKGNAAALMELIQRAEAELNKEYGADVVLKANSVEDSVAAFIRKIFPEASETEICLAELDIMDL